MLEDQPFVAFPQNACGFHFGGKSKPLPVGALIHLWEQMPLFRGDCPECSGPVYGYTFAGLLNTGGISGCCLDCHAGLHRWVGGLAKLQSLIDPILSSTPYFLGNPILWGTVPGPRPPLVEALQRCGATDLPSSEWAAGSDPPAVGYTPTSYWTPATGHVEVEDSKPITFSSQEEMLRRFSDPKAIKSSREETEGN